MRYQFSVTDERDATCTCVIDSTATLGDLVRLLAGFYPLSPSIDGMYWTLGEKAYADPVTAAQFDLPDMEKTQIYRLRSLKEGTVIELAYGIDRACYLTLTRRPLKADKSGLSRLHGRPVLQLDYVQPETWPDVMVAHAVEGHLDHDQYLSGWILLSGMANTYGFIPLKDMYRIWNAVDGPLEEKRFLDLCAIYRHDAVCPFTILTERDMYTDADAPESLMEAYLAENSLLDCGGITQIEELRAVQASVKRDWADLPLSEYYRRASLLALDRKPETMDLLDFFRGRGYDETDARGEMLKLSLALQQGFTLIDFFGDGMRHCWNLDTYQDIKTFSGLYCRWMLVERLWMLKGWSMEDLGMKLQPGQILDPDDLLEEVGRSALPKAKKDALCKALMAERKERDGF